MGFCDWFLHISYLSSDYIYACNVIFAVVSSFCAAIALGRIYSKNHNSKLTFGLLCACCGNLFVACEVATIAWILVHWEIYLESELDAILIVLFFHLCQVQTSSLFLLVAIQRFLLWKKPITFMNQKKKTIAAQFICVVSGLHGLTLLYLIPHFIVYKNRHVYDNDLYSYIEVFSLCVCILLTVSSIGLQTYVSVKMGWMGDVFREVNVENQSPVYFSALAEEVDGSPSDQQKICNSNMDEHTENHQDQAQRDAVKNRSSGAVPRLMVVITTMTCFIGLLNIFDTIVWADVTFGNNYSCWHSFLWEFTTYGYFMKMWMLSVALFIGCPSLLAELNFIPAIQKLLSPNPPVANV